MHTKTMNNIHITRCIPGAQTPTGVAPAGVHVYRQHRQQTATNGAGGRTPTGAGDLSSRRKLLLSLCHNPSQIVLTTTPGRVSGGEKGAMKAFRHGGGRSAPCKRNRNPAHHNGNGAGSKKGGRSRRSVVPAIRSQSPARKDPHRSRMHDHVHRRWGEDSLSRR